MVEFKNFPGISDGKKSACNAGDLDDDLGLTPGLGRSLGEGNGNPLQYSCLENPMAGGTWQATVHGVAMSWTQLSNFTNCLKEFRQGVSTRKRAITRENFLY